MIHAVVIDDEQNSRELLVNMLTNYLQSIEVIGQAGNVADAIRLIRDRSPDLVLLDIEMPGGNGFDVLKAFGSPLPFQVIIISGYNKQIAADASLQFLCKPVDLRELDEMIRSCFPEGK
ncbi:MAG: response regulator [Bacteroidota bacterium]